MAMHMKRNLGFTLIELMIVVAIIGILAAIAIPRYQDYISRTQLTRAASEVLRLKTNVEYFLSWGNFDFDERDLGWTSSNILDTSDGATYIAGDGLQINGFATNVNGFGYLQVTLGGDSAVTISGVNIFITRAQSGIWSCFVEKSNAPSWSDVYLPSSCSTILDGSVPVP